eukprot:CAMPEP_0174863600 /NCGR_PEP_ID=MMETSP1114-20130205/56536_1 /TAXON_ID=312471 /ORGANISM="Neobodo designis, Strain CCAP 1951/1" /LENGTH=109 /DNA_ID=CAMNT_0016098671 /DNA_START=507 /DNA_END=833 /DNA_ORIENTATION=+
MSTPVSSKGDRAESTQPLSPHTPHDATSASFLHRKNGLQGAPLPAHSMPHTPQAPHLRIATAAARSPMCLVRHLQAAHRACRAAPATQRPINTAASRKPATRPACRTQD